MNEPVEVINEELETNQNNDKPKFIQAVEEPRVIEPSDDADFYEDFYEEEQAEVAVPTETMVPVKEETVQAPVSETVALTSAEKNAPENLDDSYVLSNFDVLFDSLYNDVAGATNYISELIDRKNAVNKSERVLDDVKSNLDKEKADFDKYIEAQKKSVELEKKQTDEYINSQKLRLQTEEYQFHNEAESTRTELRLLNETVQMEKEQLHREKDQFASYKTLEEEKLKNERVKLDSEKDQYLKEKTITEEALKNSQKELQAERDQFNKYKELEEKKLELESRNLAQSCAKFKELVSQFNTGVAKLPEDKE